jgi:hypothetical protein
VDYPLKIVIFHSYVSLPEDKQIQTDCWHLILSLLHSNNVGILSHLITSRAMSPHHISDSLSQLPSLDVHPIITLSDIYIYTCIYIHICIYIYTRIYIYISISSPSNW